jgi:hypothetical protein
MNEIDHEGVVELPFRLAMTLVDTGSLLSGGLMGTTPTTGDTGVTPDPAGTPSATSGGLLSDAMARLNDATAVAQTTDAGAQAQNIDSPGSTTFASAP